MHVVPEGKVNFRATPLKGRVQTYVTLSVWLISINCLSAVGSAGLRYQDAVDEGASVGTRLKLANL